MSSGAIKTPPAGRKRATLREMADLAFDEAHSLRIRSAELAGRGIKGHPRSDDIRRINTLEDICHFLDAVRDLKGPVKDEIRKQISETKQRKAAQDKLNSVEMHSEQDRT